MYEVDGYKFFEPDEVPEPSPSHIDDAAQFLGTLGLEYADKDNFMEGVNLVGTMLATSDASLEKAADGQRHAEDLDVDDRVVVVLAEKKDGAISKTIHFVMPQEGQVLIDHFMGYEGEN